MVRRSTWILLLIFVILACFAFLYQRFQANKTTTSATSTPTTAPELVYDLSASQVDDIKIADSLGKNIDLYRGADSTKWAIKDIPADKVDSSKIESASTQLFDLQVQQTITETLPLEAIGLFTPAYTITMTTAAGNQTITNVGSQTPLGSGYYIRVNSGQVMIVNKLVMDEILGLLSNPPLLATPTPEVTSTDTVTPTLTINRGTPTP